MSLIETGISATAVLFIIRNIGGVDKRGDCGRTSISKEESLNWDLLHLFSCILRKFRRSV